jgi:hypothetical protein
VRRDFRSTFERSLRAEVPPTNGTLNPRGQTRGR